MTMNDNPFFQTWNTPFGAPPFDLIKLEHFEPAFDRGIAEYKADIDAITAQTDAPTFDNTIIKLESAGKLLDRVSGVFHCLCGTMSTDAIDALDTKLTPILSALGSDVYQNPALYQRIKTINENRSSLPAQAQQVVEKYHLGFIKAGAHLNDAQKAEAKRLNTEISQLATAFSQNVTQEEKDYALILETPEDIEGLSKSFLQAAAAEATRRGQDGKYAVTLSLSMREAFFPTAANRKHREELYRAWKARGQQGNKNDNTAIIEAIALRRRKLANLMGYETFADFQLADKMAETPAAVFKLLDDVWKPAKRAMLADQKDLEEMAKADGINEELKPWDWWYYAEKVRQAKYNLDEEEVRQYLSLDNCLNAMFYTAGRLFGLSFTERKDLPVYHPDVRAWEVTKDGAHVALFYGDYFARSGDDGTKHGGAWMSELREQNGLESENATPIVYNSCNYLKPPAGEPALIGMQDYLTLFHEFGHALHGMLSRAQYPSLAGTRVKRDFVELPSQLYEKWAFEDEVLKKFALHHETGQPMPKELVDRIKAADKFNQGFATAEYIGSSILDMEWHTGNGDTVADINARTQEKLDLPAAVTPRHLSTHFGHIVSGYAAGYYGYMWADVMVADAFDAFKESGDPFNPELAKKLYENIYSAAATEPPQELYRKFRGRDAGVEALLADRGLDARQSA